MHAKEKGERLVSNRTIQCLLDRGNAALPPKPLYTGTLVAYPERDGRIGKTIECTDPNGEKYVLDTSRFEGIQGAALVLESGTYEIREEKGVNIIVPSDITIVYSFPQASNSNRQFAVHTNTAAIPTVNGKKVVGMLRNDNASIAPVVRALDGTKQVWLHHAMSKEFGIMLEPPAPSIV